MGKKVGPAGIEPATWRIKALFLYGNKMDIDLNYQWLKRPLLYGPSIERK
jgi:hypothetical protein